MEDDEIRTILRRLSRPHASGGAVVERAAIMAEGHDVAQLLAWIEEQGGEPELAKPAKAARGLHSARLTAHAGGGSSTPQRYVLPAGTLDDAD
jgi:hypothetical protein